jgi:hypothetical protein
VRPLLFIALATLSIAPAPARLRVDGSQFVNAAGESFHWRGISAFRLVEMVAHGREREAAAYVEWAAARKLTVVRVLTMADLLFKLTPEQGTAALPRVLEIAAAHGLHVEVVALSDTGAIRVDLAQHVKAVGAIAASRPNALVEIANEPVHPTQRPDVHSPDNLRNLAALVPQDVPVSLGSIETGEGFAAGSYVTWHVHRTTEPDRWGHVLATAEGAEFVTKFKKPVISDEPIGAAASFIEGRRDNDPARFRAAALVTRLAGLGATFHYEGGLQARIPRGRELECFNAWSDAWRILPDDVETRGVFGRAGEQGSAVAGYDKDAAAGVFERRTDREAWAVAVGVKSDPRLRFGSGWRVVRTQVFPGTRVVTLTRD